METKVFNSTLDLRCFFEQYKYSSYYSSNGDYIMGKKQAGSLKTSIKKLRTENNKIFDELDNLADRVDGLEAANKANAKAQASTEMRLRDLEIKFRSKQGEKHTDLSKEYGLTEGRISQIANK
ncbi:hypothetical protein CAG70_08420 [Photobacterium halotolerans]|nr:hypothetical protein [Photobacterium halotolerans]